MVMPCFYNFLSSLIIDVYGVLIRIFVSFLLVLLSLLLIDDPAKGQSVFFFPFLYSKRVVLSTHPNFKECSKT